MGRISGVRVGSSIGGKSKGGRKNKDVVQSSSGEGSRFWKKLRTFLGCMFWSSKGEDSSINKINQVDHGAVHLTWPTRMKIAIGAANGMSFLHEEASRPLIFGDFKTSSILLDKLRGREQGLYKDPVFVSERGVSDLYVVDRS
ncbi:hypothetical protein VIGAN_11040900 [Vigna angularis var. angularis]|uniref:Protein kinase domain-containing protein n=1 Tax=Vigna angularis var. angularis TaxID=157739 RepID=A0A0S3T899_PHAAN|nr:hypothetical protein VIGAN_11040900 [Vigna angularis var. angularis]